MEGQEPMGAIDRAALRYREVRAICADFAQVIEVRVMRDTVESAGRICQQRPNLLSMRFTDPDGDMVISDGDYLWAYYPSRNERQVMRQRVSDSPGREDFFREFLEDPGTKYEAEEGGIEIVEGRDCRVVTLTPRAGASYRRARLWIDTGDHVIRRIEIHEQSENVRTVTLTDIDLASAPDPAPSAPEALGRQEPECEPGRFTGIMKNPESTTVQMSADGMSLCMHTSGNVVMTGDGTAVASMDPGSRLVLASRAERLHRMAITSGPDGLEYEWSIDGRAQPLDDEARAWRDLMLTVLTRTREAWDVRRQEGSLRRQIGSHERHVASLSRQIHSHERHVASLLRQTGSYERHVAGLLRQIGSHERHVAGLQRQIGSHERQVESLRRQLASTDPRLASLERSMREIERRIERYDLAGKISGIEARIARYDLDGKIRGVEAAIARYNLAGKVRGIEARIGEYDLDGRIRAIEAEIEELDADRRAEEIERSIEDDIAALKRLISTTGRGG